MNAKEARALATGLNSERSMHQYKEVMAEISKAVKDGKFKISIYSNLDSQVEFKLKQDEYDIKYTNDRNETLTIISW